MKKKAKLIATISSLGLALAMMVFAVYAATSVTFKVTTNVSFEATKHVQASIVAKDTGALASAPTNASYTIPAKTGAEQTIGINPDGTDNGAVTDVEFVGAELTATNKYYGYQITITNNDDENKLPVTVTIPEHTGTGYTVTYKVNGIQVSAGENVVEVLENKDGQNNVYVITCDVVITDLAGNTVTINEAHLNIEKILLGVQEESNEDYSEATPDYLTYELVEDVENGNYYKVAIDEDKINGVSGVSTLSATLFEETEFDGQIVVPAYIDGIPVKEVYGANGYYTDLSNVTSIILPETIEIIGNNAFQMASITEINLPTGVTTIGGFAFMACYKLTAIVLPNNVSIVGDEPFMDCPESLKIYCEAESKPTGWTTGWAENSARMYTYSPYWGLGIGWQYDAEGKPKPIA